MAPQSRVQQASFGHSKSTPNLPSLDGFQSKREISPDERTPTAPNYQNIVHLSSADELADEEDGDADFQSHYSIDGDTSSGSSDSEPDRKNDTGNQRPLLRHSTSAFLSANAFAPPFYNRPPTPLPPSPSFTSLLRPSFSATTSRPTTPDSSDIETPNDTEAAVAKSARTATTVPRASPKVPTYEYYGFVLYLVSFLVFCRQFILHLCLKTLILSSDISPMVLPPFAFPPPTRNLLLPQSLVVSCHPLLPRHVHHLHLRRAGLV